MRISSYCPCLRRISSRRMFVAPQLVVMELQKEPVPTKSVRCPGVPQPSVAPYGSVSTPGTHPGSWKRRLVRVVRAGKAGVSTFWKVVLVRWFIQFSKVERRAMHKMNKLIIFIRECSCSQRATRLHFRTASATPPAPDGRQANPAHLTTLRMQLQSVFR